MLTNCINKKLNKKHTKTNQQLKKSISNTIIENNKQKTKLENKTNQPN